MKKISIYEYKRRVFNECMLECMCKLHGQILNGAEVGEVDARATEMANRMCRTFIEDDLNLAESTIKATTDRLSEAVTFIKDCVNVSTSIANEKAEEADDEDLEMDDEQEIELDGEDKDLIDKLFNEKSPELQVDAIRDATVTALLAEEKKSAEIRDSLSIANSQVAAGADPSVLKETIDRLDRGPTSLMNAVINSVTQVAVKNVSENSGATQIGQVMSENADEIKTRAVMVYTLYEMANVFGIHRYSAKEVEELSKKIYYNK